MLQELHTDDLGTWGEVLVEAQAIKHNCTVYRPSTKNTKSDLVIETSDGKLHRVQVKTCNRIKRDEDVTILELYKATTNYRRRYEVNEFDWFAVVDTKTEKIAWIAATILAEDKSTLSLRHEGKITKKDQRINMFDDYTEFPL